MTRLFLLSKINVKHLCLYHDILAIVHACSSAFLLSISIPVIKIYQHSITNAMFSQSGATLLTIYLLYIVSG